MTPKEKAVELVYKYLCTISNSCVHESYCKKKECKYNDIIICKTTQNQAKQCALILIDEVLNVLPKYEYGQGEKCLSEKYEYWLKIKKEIKLK